MKYCFFAVAACLFSLTGQAKIVETTHIADAIPYIDEETWFLVDLDNTLFQAKQALGHAHWFYDEVQKRVEKGMSREEAIRDAYPDWIKTQQVCAVIPLEEDFVPSLIALQSRGVVVMGLTHRQPSVAQSTVSQVASLGFDFIKTAPSKDSFVVPAASAALYLQGILFVGDYNKKGDVFPPFLSMIGKSPKKVVFIDDKRKNVEELEQALAKCGIEYIGIHYRAIEQSKPIYSPELAQYQYQFLDRILSNEAASLLMQYGVE
jgi:hypothetical protein